MSQPAVLLPDPYFRFEFPPRPDQSKLATITLDPIETMIEIGKIVEKNKDAENFEWLADFKAWIKQASGIDLTMGEADALWKAVQVQRKRVETDFTRALESPNSTESTPTN